MFKHLLVPLDGSQLAEAALPTAAYLAETLGATVTLVHVVERGAPQQIHGERHLSEPGEAWVYLDRLVRQAFPPGVQVEVHVHTAGVEDVAWSIVEHVGELGPDLIVMCTHGRGGLRAWLLGSIAQQVIAQGSTPVLLVRPDADRAASRSVRYQRLVVPVDGHPDHEQGLKPAADLARACSAHVHLIMVVPTLATLRGERSAAGRFLPAATAVLLDMSEENAAAYLRERVAALQDEGLEMTAEVRRGDPAVVVVQAAEQVDADLIVLGTHGKSGLDAFWAGSVAPQITSRSRIPLLLVPVGA